VKVPRNIVGPVVRELREKQNLTQSEYVAKLNLLGWDVSRGTVARIEGQVRCLVGGFVFAAKAWRIQFLVALAEKHRSVWEKIMDKPQLHRIFAKEVNVLTKPITPVGESARYILLVQYETGWETAKFLDRKRLPALANGIGIFFSFLWFERFGKNTKVHTTSVSSGSKTGRLRLPGDFKVILKSPTIDVSRFYAFELVAA
jgi:hypothetical protein